jgi:hypothetical protein
MFHSKFDLQSDPKEVIIDVAESHVIDILQLNPTKNTERYLKLARKFI